MAKGGGDREGGALKTALVVLGGLGLAWLTMETAFKPYLDHFRRSMARSDPARDPDDDDGGVPDGEAGPHIEDTEEEKPRPSD